MSLEYMGESSRKHETPRFFDKKIKTWKLHKRPLHFTHLFGYGFCIESKKAIVLIHLFSQRCIPVVPYNLSNESLLLSLQDLNLSNIFYSYSIFKKSWFHSQIFFPFPVNHSDLLSVTYTVPYFLGNNWIFARHGESLERGREAEERSWREISIKWGQLWKPWGWPLCFSPS